MNRRPSVVNVLWVVLAVIALAVAVRVIPANGQRGSANPPVPRPVASRDSLPADEEATIQLFEKARGSVVYITTQERVLDPWTRNILNIPRGTGSGFVWDDRGNIVTNGRRRPSRRPAAARRCHCAWRHHRGGGWKIC